MRLVQRVVGEHIVVVVEQIRLAVVVAEMGVHIHESRQNRGVAVILSLIHI